MSDRLFTLLITISFFVFMLLWVPFLELCLWLSRRFSGRRLPVLCAGLALLSVHGRALCQFKVLNSITTYAGNGTRGFSGDGGQATNAEFNNPYGVAVDKAGNLYIADVTNSRVRKVAPNGIITTVAGNGTAGFAGDGGQATSAELKGPQGLALDSSGNLYIADINNSRIRKVSPAGIISTIAGNGTSTDSGDNGPATSAGMAPSELAFDATGNLYVVSNNVVRKISASGTITTFAGTGASGFSGDGGLATVATFSRLGGLAVDAAGNVYIADSGNHRVREVTIADGKINTFAGTGGSGSSGDGGPALNAQLTPIGLALDASGNLYITDQVNYVVREILAATKDIITVAGNGTSGNGGDGYLATSAQFDNIQDIAIDGSGNLYVADYNSNRIRAIGPLFIPSTAVGSSAARQYYLLQTTAAETITSFIASASQGNKQEYVIGAVTGCVVNGTTSNAAGSICAVPITFTPAYPGQRPVPLLAVTSGGNLSFGMNGLATAPLATLTPGIINTLLTDFSVRVGSSMAMDNAGDIFVPDYDLCVVYKITPALAVSTVVGMSGQCGSSGNAGPATSAQIWDPQGIALDSAGNLYIASGGTGSNELRKVSMATGTISNVAGNGTYGYSGDGGLAVNAEIGSLSAVAVDPAGNLYLCDHGNSVIRKVNATTGIITTIAGTGATGYNGDNQPATSANISPFDVSTDAAGNVYIADSQRLRRVDATTGTITTVAGNGGTGAPTDGVAATSSTIGSESAPIFDAAGDFFFGSSGAIRKVTISTGLISTVAGINSQGFVPSSGDGGLATQAYINPSSVTLDPTGNLLIVGADYLGSSLRRVDASTTSLTYPTSTAVGSLDTADDPKTAILSNIGNEPLTGFSGNGAITSSWLIDASSTCFPFSPLAAGSNCTLPVDFKPTISGSLTGTLTLLDNSLNAQPANQTIALSGTATGGSLSISPTTQTFTATAVGSISSSATSTITNNTSSVAYLSAGSLSDSTDFTQTDNCKGTVLNGGGTCTVTFNFTPQSTGPLSSTYTISGADYTNNPLGTLTVALSGTGNPAPTPQAVLNPTSLTFTTVVNTAASNQSVTLSNPGAVTLNSASFGISGTNASSFTVVSNNCGNSLAAGSSCTITVGFPVIVAGTYSATLTVTDNASPATQSVSLTGLVTGAGQATLTPPSINFGNVTTGSSTASQTLTLANTGTASYSITSISLIGTNASSFSITSNTCGSSLGVGSSCSIAVNFAPTSTGAQTASLIVVDSEGTQTSSLSGTGNAVPVPKAVLNPSSLTFTTVVNTTASSQSVTLSNPGNATLNISSVGISGTNASAFTIVSNNCGSSLAAGGACTIAVGFPVITVSAYNATLTVTDNASPTTQTVSLTGSVNGVAQASLTPSTLNFGNVTAGSSVASQTLTLANVGTASFSIASIGLTGTNAASFSITSNNCGSSLGAGSSCIVAINFKPSAAATQTASLTVVDSAGMQTSSLSGTGVVPATTPDFMLTATPANQSSYQGTSVTYQLVIAPAQSSTPFTTAIALTASGLPSGATATFAPASVTPGAATVGSVMTVAIPALYGENRSVPANGPGRSMILSATLLFALGLTGKKRLRRYFSSARMLLLLALIGSLCTAMTGCGAGTGFAVPRSTSTITITGTSGTLIHSATVTLTLK